MTDSAADQLSEKIAAGEARNAQKRDASLLDQFGEKAIEAKDKFTDFAKEHPVTVVVGALAVGVIVSSLFKGSPTRKVGRRAAGMAAIGGELALAYMQSAMEAAGEAGRVGAERLDDLTDSINDNARSLRRNASHRVAGLNNSAHSATRSATKAISRVLSRH